MISNSDGDYTVEKLYSDLSKEMSREIFDAIMNYLLVTTRIGVDKKSGFIYCSWNPVRVKKALQ